jgi:hypothetical protein
MGISGTCAESEHVMEVDNVMDVVEMGTEGSRMNVKFKNWIT